MNDRIPKLAHHKPTNRAYVRLNGRQVYLGKWGTPEAKQAYQRTIAEWLSRGCQPAIAPDEITIDELCLRYLRHAEAYYVHPDGSQTEELLCVKLAVRPLREVYGTIKVVDFGPLALKVVREKMIGLNWTRTTINSACGRIKRMVKWGVENELVPPSVHQALACVAGLREGRSDARESEPVRPVDMADVDAVRPFLPSPVLAMIDLQLASGARSGEVVGLRAVDIDTSGEVWQARMKRHKTSYKGKERILYFGPRAQDIIRPFMANRGIHEYLFSPKDSFAERAAQCEGHRRPDQKPTPRQTDRQVGDRYTTDSYCRAIARACVQAGIPSWHPHQLRHAAATLVRHRFGLEAAQVILGHARADVTQLYAEINGDKARSIAAQIG